MNIIGDKSVFAIQYELLKTSDNRPWGKVMLWFNNIWVGNWEDEDYLFTIEYALEVCMDSVKKSNEDFFKDKTPESIVDFINDQKDDEDSKYDEKLDVDKNIFRIGSSIFDDFSIFCYKVSETKVCFLSKLYPPRKDRYPGYPETIQKVIIEIDDYFKIVKEFDEVISR